MKSKIIKKLNSINIIEEVILREIKEIVYSKDCKTAPYVKFIVIATAIEFLGACGDPHEFNTDQQSENRFNNGLKYFPKKYIPFSKKDSKVYLYEDFRCHMIHQLRPSTKISLTERGRGYTHLDENIESGKTILILEDLYDDLEKAAKKFIKKSQTGKVANNKKINDDYVIISNNFTGSTESITKK